MLLWVKQKWFWTFCVPRIRNEFGWGFIWVSSESLCSMWHRKKSFLSTIGRGKKGEKKIHLTQKTENVLKNRFGVCRLNAKQLKLLLFMGFMYKFYMYICARESTHYHGGALFFHPRWWRVKVAALEGELNFTCIWGWEGKSGGEEENYDTLKCSFARWNFNFDILLPLRL